MSCENILSMSSIRKSDFDFTWSKIEVEDLDLKNVPKELENMDEGFNTVDVTAGDATIEGGMELELRTWGVKGIWSRASEIEFVLTFEDTESDLYENIDVNITDNIEDENIIHDGLNINPSYINVEIDMKNQKDPSQFETKATIYWQGVY